MPGDSERLFNLAIQATDTRFVFAQMRAMNFRFWNILVLARTAEDFFADNIYFDVSGTVVLAANSPIEPEFTWALRNVGIDHVLLGSDYPQLDLEGSRRTRATGSVRRGEAHDPRWHCAKVVGKAALPREDSQGVSRHGCRYEKAPYARDPGGRTPSPCKLQCAPRNAGTSAQGS